MQAIAIRLDATTTSNKKLLVTRESFQILSDRETTPAGRADLGRHRLGAAHRRDRAISLEEALLRPSLEAFLIQKA